MNTEQRISDLAQMATKIDRRFADLKQDRADLLAAVKSLCSHYLNPAEPGTGLAENINAARALIKRMEG